METEIGFWQAFVQPETFLIIGSIVLLLCCSGFFSGSETALTATSRARMHRLGAEGDKSADLVTKLTDDRERLIGAILLGNNFVNNLSTALATSLFVTLFGEGSGVALATFVMTALVLIFAEVLPKTYAIINSDRFAMFVSRPISIVVVLFAPVVLAVQFIVRRTLRTFGANIEPGQHILSARDELRGAIDLHHREGAVQSEDRAMLGGLLDLHELEVADVMVHRKNMDLVDAAQPTEVIINQVLSSQHSRIPLYKDDQENIIGVLHAKDLLRALGRVNWDISQVSIEDLLTKPWFVPETTSLNEQLQAFRVRRMHFAIVVDEYGAIMGLVTLEDIIEEVVGEIADEHDRVVVGVRPQPDGSYNVDGSVAIRDLNRALDWGLPDDEATTIAGLVIHEAQAIPDPGQVFSFYGFKFEVLRRQRNQITALRITPPPADPTAPEDLKPLATGETPLSQG